MLAIFKHAPIYYKLPPPSLEFLNSKHALVGLDLDPLFLDKLHKQEQHFKQSFLTVKVDIFGGKLNHTPTPQCSGEVKSHRKHRISPKIHRKPYFCSERASAGFPGFR